MRLLLRRLPLVALVSAAALALGLGLSMLDDLEGSVQSLFEALGVDLLRVARADEGLLTEVDIARLEALDEVAAAAGGWGTTVTAAIPGRPHQVAYQVVTSDLADVLGLECVEGVWLSDGKRHEVVLGARVAQDVFGEAGGVGQVLDGLTVVGVLAEFEDWDAVRGDLNNTALVLSGHAPSFADVHPGAFEQLLVRVQGDGEAARARIAELNPAWRVTDFRERARVAHGMAIRATRAGTVGAACLMALVGVGVSVWLTMSILDRTREIGIRRAVGASRGAVALQMVGESAAATGLGGLCGAALSAVVGHLVWRNVGWGHALVPAYALGLGLLAAGVPAAAAASLRPVEALARRTSLVGRRSSVGAARWVAALAVALTVWGVGLAIEVTRAVQQELRGTWGASPDRVLIVGSGVMSGPDGREPSVLPEYDLRRGDAKVLASVEDVDVVAYAGVLGGQLVTSDGRSWAAQSAFVGPGFGRLDLLQVLAGRSLTEEDLACRDAVCVVGRRAAIALFGAVAKALDESVLAGRWSFRIVGVYEDAQARDPIGGGLVAPLQPDDRQPAVRGRFLVRVAPGAIVTDVREAIRSAFSVAHPRNAPIRVLSLSSGVDRILESVRTVVGRTVPILALAIVTALWVVMGIVAKSLSSRTREFGVRRALGMRRGRLRWCGASDAVSLTWPGLVLGFLLAGATEARVRQWVYGSAEGPTQWASLALILAGSLALIGLLGAALAGRAAREVPGELLRKGEA